MREQSQVEVTEKEELTTMTTELLFEQKDILDVLKDRSVTKYSIFNHKARYYAEQALYWLQKAHEYERKK